MKRKNYVAPQARLTALSPLEDIASAWGGGFYWGDYQGTASVTTTTSVWGSGDHPWIFNQNKNATK